MSDIKKRLEKLERASGHSELIADYGIDWFYGDETAVRYLTLAEYKRRLGNRTMSDYHKWLNDPTRTRFFLDSHYRH